jgi:hypothetical protein
MLLVYTSKAALPDGLALCFPDSPITMWGVTMNETMFLWHYRSPVSQQWTNSGSKVLPSCCVVLWARKPCMIQWSRRMPCLGMYRWLGEARSLVIMKWLLRFPVPFLAPHPCPTVLVWPIQPQSRTAALLTGCRRGHWAMLTLLEQSQPGCMKWIRQCNWN